MKPGKLFIIAVLPMLAHCFNKPHNVFTFCRDFDANGCITPEQTAISYTTEKTIKNKTIRDFANSIYFRGDRLAFEVKNAYARWPVSFECVRGYYYFGDATMDRHELEYIELRDKNVYGLVMLGSLIEKKYAGIKQQRYYLPADFTVTYSVSCGKDLLAKGQITIGLK